MRTVSSVSTPAAWQLGSAIRFIAVGVLNTLVGLSIIYALKWVFGVGDVPANIVGYAVGLCVSYVLNARWTFAFSGRLHSAIARFVVTVLVAYLTNLAAVGFALHVLQLNSYVAQAAGVAPYALVSYLGFKYFVFTERPSQELRRGS
jgi:putative flippase GtrA